MLALPKTPSASIWTPPITTLWGLWFLLPLIGNLIWYITIQRAINDFWQARGGTMTPGLT